MRTGYRRRHLDELRATNEALRQADEELRGRVQRLEAMAQAAMAK